MNKWIRVLLLWTILFPPLGYSWNVSALLEKVQQCPPTWMDEKIDKEFSFFQNGVTSDQITVCLQNLKGIQGIEVAGLVRIRLVSGVVSCDPMFALNSEQWTALHNFLSALELLHSTQGLPDLDFILCVAPNFDRPLPLMHTTVPIFAVSKERHNNKVVLIPRLWNTERESLFHPFNSEWEKKKEIAFWRGAASDGVYGFYGWDFNPRAHLCLQSQRSGLIDAAIVPTPVLEDSMERWLRNLSLCASLASPQEQSAFKYLLSLDGRASPSSLEWQFFSKSLVFKSDSTRVEWFYDLLQPGVHYIVFHPDGGDLIEKILWAKAEDSQAETIAQNALRFAEQHLLDEEVFLYLFHLLKKYDTLGIKKNECYGR